MLTKHGTLEKRTPPCGPRPPAGGCGRAWRQKSAVVFGEYLVVFRVSFWTFAVSSEFGSNAHLAELAFGFEGCTSVVRTDFL